MVGGDLVVCLDAMETREIWKEASMCFVVRIGILVELMICLCFCKVAFGSLLMLTC